jgi:osmotically inducible protein OsmC
MKVLFTASATTVGGRNGHSEASDGVLKVDLSVPKEMGGPGKPGTTTPEHLFACGYSACYGGALEYVAAQKKKPLKKVEVTARVGIGPRDDMGFQLTVDLDVRLPDVSQAEAEALVAEAHKICPYSHATKGNITVNTRVLGS